MLADPLRRSPSITRLLARISSSRFFTISFGCHLLLVMIFGGTVLYQVALEEPADFVSASGPLVQPPPPSMVPPIPAPPVPISPHAIEIPQHASPVIRPNPISSDSLKESFRLLPPPQRPFGERPAEAPDLVPAQPGSLFDSLTREQLDAIQQFNDRRVDSSGTREPEYEFTAFIGQYQGGNWYSTVRRSGDRIVSGSLPNLLYTISRWTKDKIRTNERHVKAIRLDSDELFTERHPFIFLSGTRDFSLTEKEVENLRAYLALGGAVWGDASVPGERSRFDLAFRREMRRVLPDKNIQFEPLPVTHPIFSRGHFREIGRPPAGINHYQLPVYAMKVHGEIAVLYTANDYGDLWQIALRGDDPKSSEIDLTNDRGRLLYTSEEIWRYRDNYIYNLNRDSVIDAYKFGINVVLHLLTRWENKSASAPRL